MPTDKRTVTPRRRAANRAAAQQSTGPRTEEGKARSAQNSLRHGAFAQEPAIRTQALERTGNKARYEALRQSLASDWRPATPQQEQLVDSLAWLSFLRDEARQAFLRSQERRMRRAPLEREWKRWQKRNWAPSVTDDDCINVGLAGLAASEDKFERLAVVLAELRTCAEQGAWKKEPDGLSAGAGWSLRLLCGDEPRTGRLRRLQSLWTLAQYKSFPAKDPRRAEILALIGELERAMAEERAFFDRNRALEEEMDALDEAEGPGLFPLDGEGAALLRQMEQIERQINAKVRLLLRLGQPVARTSAVELRDRSPNQQAGEGSMTGRSVGAQRAAPRPRPETLRGTGQAAEPADEHANVRTDGTKPTKPLESVDLIEADREKARALCLQLGIKWGSDPEPGAIRQETTPCER